MSSSSSYYTRLLKQRFGSEYDWRFITSFVLAVFCHLTAWVFLGKLHPGRGLTVAAHFLLICAHVLMLPVLKLEGPLAYVPILGISVASFIIYLQRWLSSSYWLYLTYVLPQPTDPSELIEVGPRHIYIPMYMICADLLLLLVVIPIKLSPESEGPETDEFQRHSILPQAPKKWWNDIEIWEDSCSHASWWQGLGTIPCDHGFRLPRKSLAWGLQAAYEAGVKKCNCCDIATNMYPTEYLLLVLYLTSVIFVAALSMIDLSIIIVNDSLMYLKIGTYFFMWLPHFLYTCPYDQKELKKRYMFAYWMAVFCTSVCHYIAVDKDDLIVIRYISVVTEFFVISLMPEAISDAVAESKTGVTTLQSLVGLRGAPHKKAVMAVVFSCICIIIGIYYFQEQLPSMQFLAIALTIVGLCYPCFVILDRVDYVQPRGRRVRALSRGSSALTDEWWAKRPGPMPSEEEISILPRPPRESLAGSSSLRISTTKDTSTFYDADSGQPPSGDRSSEGMRSRAMKFMTWLRENRHGLSEEEPSSPSDGRRELIRVSSRIQQTDPASNRETESLALGGSDLISWVTNESEGSQRRQ